jgi:hypothetical protein
MDVLIKRCLVTLSLLLFSVAALAQDQSTDLERRLEAVENKVAQLQKNGSSPDLDEVRRQIEILSKEIEALKNGQQKPVAEANTQSYGLGAAASKVYRSEPGVSFGGYGEFAYDKPRHGAPARATMERGVLYTGYKFNNRTVFNSELELEGGSTERSGSVSIEFAYLDYLIRPEVNIRAGLMLMPVGLINEEHEPTAYFGVLRPSVETNVIPATWADMGVGLFGDVGRFSYRGYVVTGLDSTGFGSDAVIREGRQAGASALANDWAAVGRIDWHPFEGTMFGGSLYSGSSGQTRDFRARVNLGEVHVESKFRGAALRALWTRGTLGDAARVNEANGLTGDKSVGSAFGGWYVEGGYDLASLMEKTWSLSPYLRYERLDTQRRVPLGFERDPENDQRIGTLGVAFKPVSQTVIKVDYQHLQNRGRTGGHQFNLGLGYIF